MNQNRHARCLFALRDPVDGNHSIGSDFLPELRCFPVDLHKARFNPCIGLATTRKAELTHALTEANEFRTGLNTH